MRKKKFWIVPLIIGIIFIIEAIILFATTPSSVDMGSPNWFDNESARTNHIKGGIFVMFVGLTIISAGFIYNAIRQSKSATIASTIMDKYKANIENTISAQDDNNKYCEYCGSKINSDENSCKNCGAKQRKK